MRAGLQLYLTLSPRARAVAMEACGKSLSGPGVFETVKFSRLRGTHQGPGSREFPNEGPDTSWRSTHLPSREDTSVAGSGRTMFAAAC